MVGRMTEECEHVWPEWDGMVIDTLPQQRFRRCEKCDLLQISRADDENGPWTAWEDERQ